MTSANLTCSLPATDKEKPLPCIEFILSSFDYQYECDMTGSPIKRRTFFTDRYVAEPKQLRELAASIQQWADECEIAFEKHVKSSEKIKSGV